MGTNITVTKVTAHVGSVIVHATMCGGPDPLDMLPAVTALEVTVGETVLLRDIEASCENPIDTGKKVAPIFITGAEPGPELIGPEGIPTLSEWGVILMVLALGAVMVLRRGR